jgi:hypothetical protein
VKKKFGAGAGVSKQDVQNYRARPSKKQEESDDLLWMARTSLDRTPEKNDYNTTRPK